MTEELFIIIGETRYAVDINHPSGITLSFENNLFNNLDSISCDRSFTFQLPSTIRNRKVFGNIDDIRSGGIGEKMVCEYRIDGLPLFSNGNIYISQYDGTFHAVMTWNVLDFLQKIKDDNVSINKLNFNGYTKSEGEIADADLNNFNNLNETLLPMYGCGVMPNYRQWLGYPLPVVPVPTILRKIEERYKDITIPLYHSLSGEEAFDEQFNLIDFGVIPHVTTTKEIDYVIAEGSYSLNGGYNDVIYDWHDHPAPLGQTDIYPFWFYLGGGSTEYFIVSHNIPDTKEYDKKENYVEFGLLSSPEYNGINATIHGYLVCTFKETYLFDEDERVQIPYLKFYKNGARKHNGLPDDSDDGLLNDPEEVGSVKGFQIGVIYENPSDNRSDRYIVYEFNFDPEQGGSALDIDNLSQSRYIFCAFNYPYEGREVDKAKSWMRVYPKFEEGSLPHRVQNGANLPDVSCLDFVKSLFYMMGGYPVIKNGEIAMQRYDDIILNINKAKNWSDKVIITDPNINTLGSFANNFAKKNWYLTKLDKTEKDEKSLLDKPEDVYEDGSFCLEVNNGLLQDEKTIIQVPWAAPFLKNGNNPFRDTGKTFKYWDSSYGSEGLTAKAATPCYGIIYKHEPENGYAGVYTKAEAGEMIRKIWKKSNPNLTAQYRNVDAQLANDKGWSQSGERAYYIATPFYVKSGRDYMWALATPINDQGTILTYTELYGYINDTARSASNHTVPNSIMDEDFINRKLIIGLYQSREESMYAGRLLQQFGKIWYEDAVQGEVTEKNPFNPYFSGRRRNGDNYTKPFMSMRAWKGFGEMNNEFVSKLLENPVVLTQKFDLSVFDISDLDMTIPIYLEQYNSYFIIIKLQRETDGICTAELAKIPVELIK